MAGSLGPFSGGVSISTALSLVYLMSPCPGETAARQRQAALPSQQASGGASRYEGQGHTHRIQPATGYVCPWKEGEAVDIGKGLWYLGVHAERTINPRYEQ